MTVARAADPVRDFGDRQVRVAQQCLGALDAQVQHVAVRCHAGGCAKRVREMAVRLALGATMRDIVRFVVVGGMRPVLIGAAAGLAVGGVEARMISSLLFRVTPGDPSTFAIAAVVVIVAGLIATWLPARRACRVDAAEALRQ